MMFAVFTGFLICWTPYICILLTDKDDTFSLQSHLFTSMIAHIHASLNFIIYGICNKRIRNAYKVILLSHICHQVVILSPSSDHNQHPRSSLLNNPENRQSLHRSVLSWSTPFPQGTTRVDNIPLRGLLPAAPGIVQSVADLNLNGAVENNGSAVT